MIELGSVLLVVAPSVFVCGLFRLKGFVFNIVAFWLVALFQVVLTGYIASFFNHFGDIRFWLGIQAVLLVPVAAFGMKYGVYKRPQLSLKELWGRFRGLGFYHQVLLAAPLLTCAGLGIANGVVVSLCTPHQWDSLSYHIARVAYYLQNGNLNPYPANYWAQTMHPKVSSVIHAWIFLVSGRNENLFQLLQYMSYWVAMLAIYGMCRRVFGRRGVALFIALIFGLLIEVLLQATTPNNDLFLTALVACILFSLLEFRESTDWKSLIPGALAAGLAAGTKASFALVVPSLAVIAAWVFIPKGLMFWKDGTLRRRWPVLLGRAALMGSLAVAIVLPSGYGDNIRLYGHPIGSEEVRGGHTFEGRSLREIITDGNKNALRFGVSFLSFDIPDFSWRVSQAQDAIHLIPKHLFNAIGVDLTTGAGLPFSYKKGCVAHEDLSYWGIAGFGLVFPMLFFALFQRKQWSRVLPFFAASVLFVLCQSYCGPYDPWRGRYFIQLAPFALPALVLAWDARRWMFKGYVVGIITLACFASLLAVMLRTHRPLISVTHGKHSLQSVFIQSRVQQMTSNRGRLFEEISRYEESVPIDATVAVRFPDDMFEYVLFGAGLTRTVIPFPGGQVFSFAGRVDYVVYCGPDSGGTWIIRKVMPGQTVEQAFDQVRAGFSEEK